MATDSEGPDERTGGEEAARGQDRLFEESVPLDKRRAIIDELVKRAAAGDVRVAAFLFDRLYGSPGAAAKPAAAEAKPASHFDLNRLPDKEFDFFVGLLEKCDTRRNGAPLGAGDPDTDDQKAVPPGPDGICA